MFKDIRLPTRGKIIKTISERNNLYPGVDLSAPHAARLAVNWPRHGPLHYDILLSAAKSEEDKIRIIVLTYTEISVSYPELAEEAHRQLDERLKDAAVYGKYVRRKERASDKQYPNPLL